MIVALVISFVIHAITLGYVIYSRLEMYTSVNDAIQTSLELHDAQVDYMDAINKKMDEILKMTNDAV